MAQYTVHHACRHDVTHQLYGPHAAREQRTAWLASTDCPDCYRARVDAERAKLNAGDAVIHRYVPLAGTPKQTSWAETIRREQMVRFRQHLDAIGVRLADQMRMGFVPEADRPAYTAEIEMLLEACRYHLDGLGQESSAKWWIDNRDRGLLDLVVVPVVVDRPAYLPLLKQPGIGPETAAKAEAMLAQVVAEEQRAAEQVAVATRPVDDNDPYDRPYYIKRIREIIGGGVTVKIWDNPKADAWSRDLQRVYINRGKTAIACYRYDRKAESVGLMDYTGPRSQDLSDICSKLLSTEDSCRAGRRHDLVERLRYIEVPA